jgi:single-stranded-DNA-specific exonuclease
MLINTSKHWDIAPQIPAETATALGDHSPILKQLLFNRGILNLESADTYLQASGSLHSPFKLEGVQQAVHRINEALENQQKIAIYGDYDADGVTATALMVQVLRKLGGDVIYHIPNRFEEGYGLTNKALQNLGDEGTKLVITVDCGIRSPVEVLYASSVGMDIIITDHHEPRGELFGAKAVVCPKQAADKYPYKNLSGVGLAYKLCEGLLKSRPDNGIDPHDWLDLVAVGTIADVVPLDGENRALVRAGLEKMRAGTRASLRALTGVARLDFTRITARDVAFMIGPRLNAAGRLDSAAMAYDLLMSEDPGKAAMLAQQLDDQNVRRQAETRKIQEEAESSALAGKKADLLFAASPDFSIGLVGLAAARLAEKFYRPSIVGCREEEFTRASCRSIPEFHMTRALDECSDLLVRHGGHAMAAGFTIANGKVPDLVERLQDISARELGERDLRPTIQADVEVPLQDLRPDVLNELAKLEPTGMGNTQAQFVSRGVQIIRKNTMGADSKHLRLKVKDVVTHDAVAFSMGHLADLLPSRVDLVYTYELNRFRGRESIQLNVRDIQPSD